MVVGCCLFPGGRVWDFKGILLTGTRIVSFWRATCEEYKKGVAPSTSRVFTHTGMPQNGKVSVETKRQPAS